NQSQIIAEQIIPENEGGFWIREIGLYDDEGVLIAVANCPETYKPQLQEGSGRTQTIRMILVVTNTEAITLKIDPSVVLATRKYVDDEVLELRLYVDDQMRKHIAAQDPHTQYAQKHNPTFTGEPKAPTPAAGNNTTRIATTAFVQAAITALINGAPDTLDTLKEIAAAINNDPKFSTTINNALSGKQPLDETLTHLSGKDVAGLLAYLHLEETVKQAAGAMQKSANGGDIQNVAAFRNALQLGTAALASMGVGKNQVLSASDFSFFAGGNGYLYIPCLATTDNPVKIMLQWGTIRTRGGENNIYNLPYAFPTAGLWAMGCRAANGYSQSMNVSIENRSQIRIQNWAPAGAVEDCCFFAVGYL
ncbi:phage tail protein, partial [Escherichia coli]|nr:phage tail protein [Escherichia coli]EHZ8349794.1 phage tail protein [Escherichia coli]